MLKFRLLTTLFAISLLLQTAVVFAKVNNEADAINILMLRINKSQVYAPWLISECSSIFTETTTAKYFEFSLHEKHGGNCEGDPNTAPVIDRFRVLKANKTILWYYVVNDEYLPFKELIKFRKLKK
jgi:hypothetical protein